ncbi:MAG: hypothetical protein QW641_01055 [Candidatus Aenigmatarchaeota archaeon]
MVKICPKCNFENSNEARFCRFCAWPIIDEPIIEKEKKAEEIEQYSQPTEKQEYLEEEQKMPVKKPYFSKSTIALIVIISIEIFIIVYLIKTKLIFI